MRVGSKCAGCGRLLRPSYVLSKDAPGTAVDGGRGMCKPCRRAQVEGRELTEFRNKRPSHCRACQRPMRQRGARIGDHPGTVQHATKGICTSCKRAKDEGREASKPRPVGVLPCRGCDRPTRPSTGLLLDYPGTVKRRKLGFCWGCLNDGTATTVITITNNTNAWRHYRKTA